MKPACSSLLSGAALVALHAGGVLGDGTGFIGLGKTLYNPTCAFACRNVIRNCKLLCTPAESSANHGTAHNPVTTPPECYVSDQAFLRTMALCIDNYCSRSDNPPMDLIEDYWASHLGTGTLGNYDYTPTTSYHDALVAAREDERRAVNNTPANKTGDSDPHANHKRQFMTEAGPKVTSALPHIKARQPLNATRFILPGDWQKQYSGLYDFEANENGHSRYALVIMFVAILLPVLLSLARFLPNLPKSKHWSSLQSTLIQPPTWGKRHREPVPPGGTMPTRGQALYISLISILNLVFLVAPYVRHHPQGTFASPEEQTLSIIGNRAGVLAMGNVVAVFLFAARNNVLFFGGVTDWSHGTYLLLHRWLGYWAVFHAALHSVLLLEYYRRYGDYAAEFAREYWVWGVVATVAVCAMVPFSLLAVRRAAYEVFVATHVVLAVLFVVGYYYHIWYCYKYAWGYEIWAYMGAGIWAADRVVRLGRMGWQGWRTGTVKVVQDTDGEYLVIGVEGRPLSDGVAYLTFPTLGWRVWESHPFSVAFTRGGATTGSGSGSESPRAPTPTSADNKEVAIEAVAASGATPKQPVTAFFARVRAGVTRNLSRKVAAAGGSLRLPVLVDGTYHHSGAVAAELSHCSSIVYVAGGVGITALLPYLRQIAKPSQLFWGSRKAGLVAAAAPALEQLPANVEVETSVGSRLDLDGILHRALTTGAEGDDGPVGIVVCGPAGMADHVRHRTVQLSRSGVATRPYVLVDEAFAW